MTIDEKNVIFEIETVSRTFGQVRLRFFKHTPVKALIDVDLKIYQKECLGIVGESGSGKTTLGRLLVALDKPTKGRISFEGNELEKFDKKSKKKFHHTVQMIFQNPFASLNPYRSIRNILESGYRAIGLRSREAMESKIQDLLESVGLNSSILDRFPHQFSGGQRQRIVIARALSVGPKVLVADEPVSALDVSIQAQVLNLLNDLRKDLALTVVFITHDLRVANFFCDRIAVMYLGRIVELGSTKNIIENSLHPYTRMLVDAAPSGDPSTKSKTRLSQNESESAINTGEGCSFTSRCWLRSKLPDDTKCRTIRPELRIINGGSQTACHHAELIVESLLQITTGEMTK
jgi:oligopeptide/dipeptide ABC transporter ATP-binding protein